MIHTAGGRRGVGTAGEGGGPNYTAGQTGCWDGEGVCVATVHGDSLINGGNFIATKNK